MIRTRTARLLTVALFAAIGAGASATATPPPSPTLGAPPPDDRTIVLCSAGDWSGWHDRDGKPSGWEPQPDGSVLVRKGDAITDRDFGDFQLHVEFVSPEMPGRTGQGRGNSGIYLHGRYEVQVLNSYGDEPVMNGCGAFYSIAPPMVNACRPGGELQTYDILFRAPRFDDAGELTELPRVTVLHNGVVIHNNLKLPHSTPGGLATDLVAEGPILLQDHGDPVRYRNVWIRPL